MKKKFKRLIVLITLAALIVALPVEIIGLARNQKAFKTEAEDKMEYAIKSAGNDLDLVFNSMESLVTMMQAMVQVTFSGKNYIHDYSIFTELKTQSGDIICRSLENTDHLSGLYVTFSPSLHSGEEEIWYAYKNGKVSYIDARLYAPSWLVEGNPRVDYYYDAVETGSYWDGLYYESSLDEYMISHTKSVHDTTGNLIGIVGSDMLISEVNSILKSIKIYDDSQIVLFDYDMDFCASSESIKNPEAFYKPLSSEISAHNPGKNSDKNTPFWYMSSDGTRHIAAYTTLQNGWILAATQPSETVMTSAINTRRSLIITMLLTIIIIIMAAVVLIKRFYDPVIKRAEQNEIMLINQSRQAKLGEMVGNISHQCKQPLNCMSIDISNMKDDYLAGELTPQLFSQYERNMRDNVALMSATITDFADFLKPDRKKEQFSLKGSVDRALSIMKESIVINEISISNMVSPDIFITNYKNEFVQCVFNILANARDEAAASDIRPRSIRIFSQVNRKDDNPVISLNIFNSGANIPDDIMHKIFLPYYSTKENTGGTGMGLYLAKQIIESHFNGRIYCTNNERGVTFTIEIRERSL